MNLTPNTTGAPHFELLSGLHTEHFIAFSQIARDRDSRDRLAAWLHAAVASWGPTVVLAPSTAGVALGASLAAHLSVPLHLAQLDRAGRAEAVLGAPELKGERVLLVNDGVTTGTGLEALAAVVQAADAVVCGAGWFASRDEVDVEGLIGAPTASVCDLPLDAWQADRCPQCSAGVPAELALDLN